MDELNTAEKIILGIDPGTNLMGYGLIRVEGKNISLMVMGVIDLKKYDNHYIKLQKIYERVSHLVEEYKPDELAIEAPFFGKNVQSMLKLGRAQGVAMAAALMHDIPIFEYAPRKIKMSITGRGEASKEQVAAILQNMLKIKELPKDLDATDGLAAAVCHFFQQNSALPATTKGSGWAAFLSKNPDRIKKV